MPFSLASFKCRIIWTVKLKKLLEQTLIAIRDASTWVKKLYFFKENKKYWKPWNPSIPLSLIDFCAIKHWAPKLIVPVCCSRVSSISPLQYLHSKGSPALAYTICTCSAAIKVHTDCAKAKWIPQGSVSDNEIYFEQSYMLLGESPQVLHEKLTQVSSAHTIDTIWDLKPYKIHCQIMTSSAFLTGRYWKVYTMFASFWKKSIWLDTVLH